jgi:hypothetical protein
MDEDSVYADNWWFTSEYKLNYDDQDPYGLDPHELDPDPDCDPEPEDDIVEAEDKAVLDVIGLGNWEVEVTKVESLLSFQHGGYFTPRAFQYAPTMSALAAWLHPLQLQKHSPLGLTVTSKKSKPISGDRVRIRIWSPDKKHKFTFIGFLDKGWAWACDLAILSPYVGKIDWPLSKPADIVQLIAQAA